MCTIQQSGAAWLVIVRGPVLYIASFATEQKAYSWAIDERLTIIDGGI